MVKNTLNSYFYKSEEEGVWHVCRESAEGEEKEWTKQDEEPVEEMAKMREELTQKLRAQFGVNPGEKQSEE